MDLGVSQLPAPPRALGGSAPVYGHTRLFMKLAGDIAHTFAPTTKEVRWNPWARQLGDCFAIFIWGQWRIVVKGPERSRLILSSMKLKEGWPWSPPINLLGKSCLCFLEDKDRIKLRRMIQEPLSQKQLIQYASVFAKYAEHCLERIQSANEKDIQPPSGKTDEDDLQPCCPEDGAVCLKMKWEAMRSYTFDLINGPILSLDITDPEERENMMRWMERMKSGVDVIKTTFGPEWMYVWILNEYGRALNGRMHIEEVVRKHVRRMNEKVPVKHERGHLYYEPSTRAIPLKAIRDNLLRNQEGVFGAVDIPEPSNGDNRAGNRERTKTMPEVLLFDSASDEKDSDDSNGREPCYVMPFRTEQDLARPKYENSPALAKRKTVMSPGPSSSHKAYVQNIDIMKTPGNSQPISVLENIMRQEDVSGHGLSQVVTMEVGIILWLSMEVGNAWTFMALNLLSSDRDACHLVLDEIDTVSHTHQGEDLFSPGALRKMEYLDALIYEAIRLTPANLGGLKKTTETIELPDAGLQIPKNSNIFFCQPTEEKFDIRSAKGQKPELLGKRYPCVELHGFLPLRGLEVPLMVLQSKVFLVSCLRKYQPSLRKRRTFIRRVKDAVSTSIHNRSLSLEKTPERSLLARSKTESDVPGSSEARGGRSTLSTPTLHRSTSLDNTPVSQLTRSKTSGDTPDPSEAYSFESNDIEEGISDMSPEVSTSFAMKLFTKTPFPEPRRVAMLRPRTFVN